MGFGFYLFLKGRVAYAGSRDGALSFYGGLGYKCPATYNPADYYVHVLAIIPDKEEECRAKTAAIADAFKHTPECSKLLVKTFDHSPSPILIPFLNFPGKY